MNGYVMDLHGEHGLTGMVTMLWQVQEPSSVLQSNKHVDAIAGPNHNIINNQLAPAASRCINTDHCHRHKH